jgi:pyruvate formate lyase activating enzyme
MTVAEVMDQVEEDRIFYENSGGGVTFSGGEPTFQFDFLKLLLKEAGQRKLHRVLETNGNVTWEYLNRLISDLELVLFDIKHLDNRVHKHFTNAGNHLILKNLERLAKEDRVIWLPRFPLIPGVNDDPGQLFELGLWVKVLGAREIHLLPYHQLGISKHQDLGYPRTGLFGEIQPPSEEDVEKAALVLRKAGLSVNIGG